MRKAALVAGRSDLDVTIRLQIVIHKQVFYKFLEQEKVIGAVAKCQPCILQQLFCCRMVHFDYC